MVVIEEVQLMRHILSICIPLALDKMPDPFLLSLSEADLDVSFLCHGENKCSTRILGALQLNTRLLVRR